MTPQASTYLSQPATEMVTLVELDLPPGTQRIWKDQIHGHIRFSDVNGPGPEGFSPLGYLTPDDRVVIAAPDAMTSRDIRFVALFHTGENRNVDFIENMTEHAKAAATSYARCRHCENVDSKPHRRTCPHAGQLVGDRVR